MASLQGFSRDGTENIFRMIADYVYLSREGRKSKYKYKKNITFWKRMYGKTDGLTDNARYRGLDPT